MKLSIIDINGYPVEITDIEVAIKTAKHYKDLSDKKLSKSQKASWNDMYEKLTTIKSAYKTH